jgi:hypothetical protein
MASGLFFLMFTLFAGSAFAVDATLAWDPNTEPDLEGYGVYFSRGKPGPPYDLFGYVTTAELEDPANPTFTVTGLIEGARYYLALTAYDTLGAESAFSAAVCADVSDTVAPCPSSSTGGGGGGSGGGGGGCFIGTTLEGSYGLDPWSAGLAALAAMAVWIRIKQRRCTLVFIFSKSEARTSRTMNKRG